MGCVHASKPFVTNEAVEGQTKSAVEVFTSICLTTRDINMLYKAFTEIDVDNSDTIRAIELFTYFNIELGGFQKHVFAVFDEDNSGVLNFMEFVCSMWNLLTLSDADLGILAYLMKDPTGALRIKYAEVREIIEIMHKKKVDSSPALQGLYTNLKKMCSSEISLAEFCKWTAANPTVLSPLLILQLKLRKQIIGERYWVQLAAKRRENPDLGDFGFIKQLQAQVKRKNAEFKNKLVEAELEVLRAKRRGPGMGSGRDNVARKQSVLLAAFNLKPLSNRATSVSPTPCKDHEDNTDLPSTSLKGKPSSADNTGSSAFVAPPGSTKAKPGAGSVKSTGRGRDSMASSSAKARSSSAKRS